MQLRSGKQKNASGRTDKTNLGVRVYGIFGTRLVLQVSFRIVGGGFSTVLIPSIMVELTRSVANSHAPIPRMEGQSTGGTNVVNRKPPVLLAKRCGIPRVAVRMDGIRQSGRVVAGVRDSL